MEGDFNMFEVRIDCANYLLEVDKEETLEECIHDVENFDIENLNDDLKKLTKIYPIYWTVYNNKGEEIAQGTLKDLIG